MISILCDMPAGFSARAAQEIDQATALPWQRNSYSDYVSSGGYEVLSLFSRDGDSTNTIIEDCTPIPTPDLTKLPTIRDFLETCDFPLMWVRLNKLAPGACFWEHRDYSELNAERKVRLHVPICTTQDSYLITGNRAIHLKPDTLWNLQPDHQVHGFINGCATRIHLIIDCYIDDELRGRVDSSYLPDESSTPLPRPPAETYDELLDSAVALVNENQATGAEELLLKTFLQYTQPEGFSFDLIVRLYERLSMKTKTQEWLEKRYRFLQQEKLQNVKRV